MKILIIFIITFSSMLFGQNQNNTVTTNSLVLTDTSKVLVDHSKRHSYKATITLTGDYKGQTKDSIIDAILDPTFQGTDQELADKINAGELERYLVQDNEKYYEKIRVPVIVDNESFIEKHFMLLCGLIIIFGFGFYKYIGNKDKKSEDVADENN